MRVINGDGEVKNSTEQSHSILCNSQKRYKLCNRDFTAEVCSETIAVNENAKLFFLLKCVEVCEDSLFPVVGKAAFSLAKMVFLLQ